MDHLSNNGRVSATRPLIALILSVFALTAALRLYLALSLDLFGDESFYRWESQNLAWGYSDLPPLTALAIRLGTLLVGDSTLGTRFIFLLSGLALPVAILWLARPVTGHRQALIAAGLSLLVPVTATMGVLAIPDSLLLTECCLVLAALERACRTQHTRWWVLAGLLMAVGLTTHYRFVFLPVALAFAFLAFPVLRVQLRQPGPWIAAGIASLGLLPIAIFNLGNDFVAIAFHFSGRHPWAFHAEALKYPLLQAGVVSPLLYGLMLWTLFTALRSGWRGNVPRALLASVSLFYILGLTLLAPWVDQTSTTLHWAWFGYVPMLVLLPERLERLWQGSRLARGFAGAALGLAALFVGGAFLGLLAPLHYDSIPESQRDKVTLRMVGWEVLRRDVAGHHRSGEVIYTNNYYVAAQLQERPFSEGRIYVLDHDKTHRDGRSVQLDLWRVSERFLPDESATTLLVIDYSDVRWEVYRHIDTLCQKFHRIETLDELSYYDGRRRFGIYRAEVSDEAPRYPAQDASDFCLPPLIGLTAGNVSFRRANSGEIQLSGYVLAQPEGIAAFRFRIDGREYEGLSGIEHPRVDAILRDNIRDPGYPNILYYATFDTRTLPNGRYDMEFIGVSNWGREEVFARRKLIIENPTE
ncbi:MAG: glycosyltransferase family 39 protein [Pseudomonadota bacterium]